MVGMYLGVCHCRVYLGVCHCWVYLRVGSVRINVSYVLSHRGFIGVSILRYSLGCLTYPIMLG